MKRSCKAILLTLALLSSLCACRKDEGGKLSIYVTPYPYETVKV